MNIYNFVRINDADNDLSISLDQKNKGKLFCNPVNKPDKLTYNINSCIAKDVNAINYWINKNVNFVINPFDYNKRYFDLNTINVMKTNKINPVIMLDEIKNLNNIQTALFLRNALIFNKFCAKKKMPIIICSGGNTSNQLTTNQEIYNYCFFDYTIEQARNFNEMIFGDLYD